MSVETINWNNENRKPITSTGSSPGQSPHHNNILLLLITSFWFIVICVLCIILRGNKSCVFFYMYKTVHELWMFDCIAWECFDIIIIIKYEERWTIITKIVNNILIIFVYKTYLNYSWCLLFNIKCIYRIECQVIPTKNRGF